MPALGGVEIIPITAEDGISAIAFAFREIIDEFGSEVEEIAMDSTHWAMSCTPLWQKRMAKRFRLHLPSQLPQMEPRLKEQKIGCSNMFLAMSVRSAPKSRL